MKLFADIKVNFLPEKTDWKVEIDLRDSKEYLVATKTMLAPFRAVRKEDAVDFAKREAERMAESYRLEISRLIGAEFRIEV